ncbi:TonB-dependent receptor [Methylococcaceae bacterium WWC4]|nr:TonB-dependent receptor [Methylococcaceae bacterium WWC4]
MPAQAGRLAGIGLLSVAWWLPARADPSMATLRGRVEMPGLADQAGAQIIVTHLDRGFSTRTVSREGGSYVLMALRPGRYSLKVLAPDGRSIEQALTLQVGQAMTLDLAVGAEAGTESASTASEIRNPELATYLTPEQMQRLPQINRNFLNYADLAPGVNVVTDQDGSTRLQSGGQRPDSVNLYIDGVSQKNYVVRGGVAGQDSSRGNVFPESAVAEYKVISQNYKAEFDQASGAVISVQTKSGGNQFHGETFYDHTNQDLRAATPSETLNGRYDNMQAQYGVTLSGPIARDVAHFFVAYERKQNDDFAGVRTADGGALPARYQSLLGEANRPFEADLFFAKLDWALDDRNSLEASFKLRDETQILGIGSVNAEPNALDKGNAEKRLDFKYQYTAEHWVNEARFTYEDSHWRQQPAHLNAGQLLQRLDGSLSGGNLSSVTVLNGGGAGNFQDKGQRGPGLQDDLTFSGLNWHGSHVVKVGAKLKYIELNALERDPYNPQFSYNLNNPDGTPYRVTWAAPMAGLGDGNGATSTDVSQVGLYLQDDWELNRHLSLSLGARWDYEYNPGYLNFVTPTGVASALRDWSNIAGGRGGYNLEDYLSNGHNRRADADNIAPRLGFAYDFDGDQRHVVFGGYGRAYDRNIYDVLQLERTKGSYPSFSVAFQGDPNYDCGAAADCIAWDPAYLNYNGEQLSALTGATPASREINLMRNNLKTPFADQFSLGIRNRIGDWYTELAVSHVHSYDGLVGVLGGRNADGSFYRAGSDLGGTFQAVPGYGQLILFDNGVQTKTNSVYLKAEKPYVKESGWGASFAYTYTDSQENKPQSFVDNSSYLFEKPDTHSVGWLDTSGVRAHKIVTTASVDLPWDVVFAAKLTLATPETRYGINCTSGACRFDTYTPRGYDFIFPGEWWGYRQFDIALIKNFDTPRDTRFKLRLDVLNLFDFKNYGAFNSNFASSDFGAPTSILAGPPLTLKLTARLEF